MITKDNLPDNFFEYTGHIIVSKRFKEYLESNINDAIEYIPISIYNLNKELIHNEYFLVHPINVIDCIDMKESVLEFSGFFTTPKILSLP